MPISDAYATPQEYRAIAGKRGTEDELLLAKHLVTCSRLVDRETGQFFGKDEEAVARIFVARDSRCLDLDYSGFCPGIADITDLEIKVDTDGDGSFADEVAWSLGDYNLYPLQADQGPEPRPWDRIVAIGNKSFIPGKKVQVTAIFGWPAVPNAVRDEVIELCRIWRLEGPRATGRMDELDSIVSASPLANSLLRRVVNAYSAKVTL